MPVSYPQLLNTRGLLVPSAEVPIDCAKNFGSRIEAFVGRESWRENENTYYGYELALASTLVRCVAPRCVLFSLILIIVIIV
jgi:hypothetical protein